MPTLGLVYVPATWEIPDEVWRLRHPGQAGAPGEFSMYVSLARAE